MLALLIACRGPSTARLAADPASAIAPRGAGRAVDPACEVACARDLAEQLAAEPSCVRRDAQDRLAVVVALRNRGADELRLMARVHFLDRNGCPGDDATTVRWMSIGGGATADLAATSRTAGADAVLVRLWRPVREAAGR